MPSSVIIGVSTISQRRLGKMIFNKTILRCSRPILAKCYSSNVGLESNSSHTPVLCAEAINYLNPGPQKIYIDMTFGAGGHCKKLLDSCKDIKVYALDRDPVAYELAQQMTKEYEGRLTPLLGRFSDLPHLLKEQNIVRHSVDGILFDFGCSSMQFEEPERGFSVSKNGPLDMRMDCAPGMNNDQVTAADVLARAEEPDLVKILRIYGEEKAAKKIARAIVDARSALHPIKTTKQLADLVASCLHETPFRLDKLQRPTHVATKTFQALRIFVNNELNEINYGMVLANAYLRLQGRLVAITFHSLEDTIVKRHLYGNVIDGLANPVPLKYCGYDVVHDEETMQSITLSNWKPLHKHVILPGEEEIKHNSRSRSAKLRAAVKLK
uniref:Putative SAM-dependent methyltransferases n=1 Tax=Glossina morsitans morsitans TaxID=37546 RepID=D3TM70_GLOMM